MKKEYVFYAVMLAMMLAMPMGARGQYGSEYYHREGDTIQFDAQIYYHNWWEFERSYRTHYHKWEFLPGSHHFHFLLSYYFTDKPLEVIGIAILQPDCGINANNLPYDTAIRQEYLYIYEADAGTDSIREVVSVPWYKNDAQRHIHIRGYSWTNNLDVEGCCDDIGRDWNRNIPIIEYYFDSVYTLQDSFYVGFSHNSAATGDEMDMEVFDGNHHFPRATYYFAGNEIFGLEYDCEGNPADAGVFSSCGINWPTIWDSIGYYNLPGISHYYTEINRVRSPFWMVPLVFPIVKVDTTVPPMSYCPEVENLQAFLVGNDSVVVTWDAYPTHQHGYEVCFGPVSQPVNTRPIVFCETNMFTLGDLSPAEYYTVRVRPICEEPCGYESEGPWCQSLTFRTADTTDAGLEPTAVSRRTTLTPNPATESVTLKCDYVVLSVDLYDAVGRHLWNQPVGATQATFELDGLAPGHYILQVTTPKGTTPKHLIVSGK